MTTIARPFERPSSTLCPSCKTDDRVILARRESKVRLMVLACLKCKSSWETNQPVFTSRLASVKPRAIIC